MRWSRHLKVLLMRNLNIFLAEGSEPEQRKKMKLTMRFIEVQGDCRGGIICLRRGIKLFKEEHVFLRDSRKGR